MEESSSDVDHSSGIEDCVDSFIFDDESIDKDIRRKIKDELLQFPLSAVKELTLGTSDCSEMTESVTLKKDIINELKVRVNDPTLCPLWIKNTITQAKNRLSDGVGNLSDSSKDAKLRFSKAERLYTYLYKFACDDLEATRREYREDRRDQAYKKDHPTEDMSKGAYINTEDYRAYTRNILPPKDEAFLMEQVCRAYAMEKTGGGSCDNCAATVFLLLASYEGASPSVVRYKPESEKIEAPAELPYHRVVQLTWNKRVWICDAWWPGKTEAWEFEGEESLFEPRGCVYDSGYVSFLTTQLDQAFLDMPLDIYKDCTSDTVKAVWKKQG